MIVDGDRWGGWVGGMGDRYDGKIERLVLGFECMV